MKHYEHWAVWNYLFQHEYWSRNSLSHPTSCKQIALRCYWKKKQPIRISTEAPRLPPTVPISKFRRLKMYSVILKMERSLLAGQLKKPEAEVASEMWPSLFFFQDSNLGCFWKCNGKYTYMRIDIYLQETRKAILLSIEMIVGTIFSLRLAIFRGNCTVVMTLMWS